MQRIKNILVVEDEEHLAFGIKYNLEAEGYHVSVANDGPTALSMIAEDPLDIDLIILDLMLPGMSGYAVCESIRDSGNQVPVLILSARTLSEDRVRGFEVGADQYLQKPFELDELISRVKNLLIRRGRTSLLPTSGTALKEYEFGRVKVNFDTFEVAVDGKPVHLTHTEMKLLRYFIENEGSVIPRATLLEKVWDMPSSLNTRTVDNFIVRLRKYFEVDPANPKHFLSVRGAGYRFVAKGVEFPAAEEGDLPGD